MYIIQSSAHLRPLISRLKRTSQKIGFVPTMGALHDGHLSLINYSQQQCDYTICSIFVNPTQFNDPVDLEKYPRTPEKDIKQLIEVGCDLVFLPSVTDIYPESTVLNDAYDLGEIDQVLEGAHRPGHFQGVAQVVHRLLTLVPADQIILGQKDYQQVAIIRQMIANQNLPTEVLMAPIIREPDGLAMSSRNVRLTPENRQKAPVIYQVLQYLQSQLGQQLPSDLEREGQQQLTNAGLQPEYVAIVDGQTLLPVTNDHQNSLLICAAVWAGEVRLIDNIYLPANGKERD